MAVFGLPGGAEWLVIGLVALLTLVPAVAVFLGGYLVGRARGRDEGTVDRPAADEAATMPEDDDE